MRDVEVLTLREYTLRMKAYQLQRVDREYEMHLQAWLNHAVTATKEQGKKQVPYYKKFKEFYDYEKRLKEVSSKKRRGMITPQMKRMARLALIANSGKGVEDG